MKKSTLIAGLLSLASLSITSFAQATEVKDFIGKYKLIERNFKETKEIGEFKCDDYMYISTNATQDRVQVIESRWNLKDDELSEYKPGEWSEQKINGGYVPGPNSGAASRLTVTFDGETLEKNSRYAAVMLPGIPMGFFFEKTSIAKPTSDTLSLYYKKTLNGITIHWAECSYTRF